MSLGPACSFLESPMNTEGGSLGPSTHDDRMQRSDALVAPAGCWGIRSLPFLPLSPPMSFIFLVEVEPVPRPEIEGIYTNNNKSTKQCNQFWF